MSDLSQKVGLEESWLKVKHTGRVYRRWRWIEIWSIEEIWSEWEEMPYKDIPFIIMQKLEQESPLNG